MAIGPIRLVPWALQGVAVVAAAAIHLELGLALLVLIVLSLGDDAAKSGPARRGTMRRAR